MFAKQTMEPKGATLESPVFAAVRMQKWPQPLKIRIHQPFHNIPNSDSFVLILRMFCPCNYHFWVGIFYAKKWCSFSFHCFWAGNVIAYLDGVSQTITHRTFTSAFITLNSIKSSCCIAIGILPAFFLCNRFILYC